MSKTQRRGGLGRGLGALIPTAHPVDDREVLAEDEANTGPRPETTSVMSTGGPIGEVAPPTQAPIPAEPSIPAEGSIPAPQAAGGGVKLINRVPSVATITASSATGFYFEPAPVPGATLRELRPEEIKTNPRQPRTVFDEDSLNELTHSIKEFGMLQPVVVRAHADGFELVMGERRLRAAVAAGLETIPAIVRDTADDAMLRDALLENIHRAQLNPLEEAAAYQQLLQEFGATHEDLAGKIGRSRSQVTNTIRLMNLPVPVQRRVAAGILSAGHARALLGLANRDQQEDLAGRIVAEGLSVRATEELVSLLANSGADGRPSSRKKPAPRITAPALAELAQNLSDTLDTRVRVDLGRRKGKITVEFGSIDDLERIVTLIAPNLATKHTSPRTQKESESVS